MIKYVIYAAAVVLIVWSIYYVVKNVRNQLSGKRRCDGNCGGCSLDCPSRKKQDQESKDDSSLP
jgi:hypothetical protein